MGRPGRSPPASGRRGAPKSRREGSGEGSSSPTSSPSNKGLRGGAQSTGGAAESPKASRSPSPTKTTPEPPPPSARLPAPSFRTHSPTPTKRVSCESASVSASGSSLCGTNSSAITAVGGSPAGAAPTTKSRSRPKPALPLQAVLENAAVCSLSQHPFPRRARSRETHLGRPSSPPPNVPRTKARPRQRTPHQPPFTALLLLKPDLRVPAGGFSSGRRFRRGGCVRAGGVAS